MPGHAKIHHGVGGAEIIAGGRRVRIDASSHTLRLEGCAGATLELGALRSSLLTTMGFVSDELGLPLLGYDHTPVSDAAVRALRSAAAARGLHDASLEGAIAEVVATPLVFAAPFLEARWVWTDAFRFRACRVAIACAEDELLDDDTPAAAATVVERLARWREIYQHADASKRAVNAALTDFGDTLPAAALWGLRQVPLSRARRAQRHLELLGWLGALPKSADRDAVITLVEATPDGELDELLDGLEGLGAHGRSPQRMAQALVDGDVANCATALQLARSALARAEDARRAPGEFPPPPIALPSVEGIRWLASAEQLREEGTAMHHCVATLAHLCRHGDAFVFHVAAAGSSATVQVDRSGQIVQARGPFNRPSSAADWGARALGIWGCGLWWTGLQESALAWPPGMAAPAGTRPLRSVRAIVDAYAAAVRGSEDPRALRAWFYPATWSAARHAIGIVVDTDRHNRARAFSVDGRCVGDTDTLELELPGLSLQQIGSRPGRGGARRRLAYPFQDVHNDPLGHRDEPHRRPWEAPPPPIPYPVLAGVRPIADQRSSDEVARRFAVDVEELVPRLRTGEAVLFEVTLDRGEVLVLVELGTRAVRALVSRNVSQPVVEGEVARLRRWTHGLWVVRVGAGRTIWIGDLRPPMATEPLRTVEEGALLYQRLVELHGDNDGALAAFFERHVTAAARGDAWLVVRDRAAGLVSVLDRKRTVIARTDELIAR